MAFELQSCISCFINFQVPLGFTAARRKDGEKFYCPNGHHMYYPKGESEEDKLRRERDLLKQRLVQKDDMISEVVRQRQMSERQLSAARGQVTKLKKRAAGGVCPCCNRSFAALHSHMATKHPNFVAEDVSA